MKKHLQIVFIALLATLTLSAQNDIEKLAAQFVSDGEFAKASELYKDLLKKRPASVYLYDNYLNTLIQIEDFKTAQKLVNKQQRRFPDNLVYAVDGGFVLSLSAETKAANKVFAELVKNNQSDYTKSTDLANAFLKRGFAQWSIKTYLSSRKSLNSPSIYSSELLQLYADENDIDALIEECLNHLRHYPDNETKIKSFLVQAIESGKTELLQERTLLFAQKYPSIAIYDDMLMWMFVQQKKYNSALRQAKGIDRKRGLEGSMLMSLAQICATNEAWKAAESCYEEVLALGANGPHYSRAKRGLLHTKFISVDNQISPSETELNSLVTLQVAFVKEYGINNLTANVISELSRVYLFKLHQPHKAVEQLEALTSTRGIQPRIRDENKLLLGDAYLVTGNVWDAQLTYSQVDKAFKEDPLGQEAKFRNARLSYFRSDFTWAKDQLEVLKTATTQLISNNAIELSLLIQDNTEMDTTAEALTAFSEMELLLFQQKFDACLMGLNSLAFKYSNHSLSDEIAYTKAQVYEKQGKINDALEHYKRVYEGYFDDILADNALFRSAVIYENELRDLTKAKALYEQLILDYTDSLFVVEARKRYKNISAQLP